MLYATALPSRFGRMGIWFLLASFLLLFACKKAPQSSPDSNESPPDTIESSLPVIHEDLADMRKRGKLVAITAYSSTSYFIYKGQPMGYEYELLNRLANHLGLELEIVIAEDMDAFEEMLYQGKGDLIAYGLTVTQERQKSLAFTEHHSYTQQMLVQRKPEGWRKLKAHQIEKKLVRNVIDLIGKHVSVRKNSSYFQRLQHLSDEIGGDILVDVVDGRHTTEEIINMVQEGKIAYTVADQNIAMLNQTYHPDLDVETMLSFPQRLAWAVRKDSPELLKAINDWILSMRRETDYYVIYNKYFKNTKAFKRRVDSDYFSVTGGKISPYDDMLKKNADSLGWDWRLLASQVYQESQFDPKTKSWAGARGLMQVMPATGKQYGVSNLNDPESNIKAGTAYLKYLEEYWENIPDSTERLKFVLASYNAGPGHVSDAGRLAQKRGLDPDIWDGNVAECILLKSKEEFFTDDSVKYGYCRGEEPYHYVQAILARYEQYEQFIDEVSS